MQEVTVRMREIGINNIKLIDRKKWSRKLKLKVQKDMKTLVLCTYIL